MGAARFLNAVELGRGVSGRRDPFSQRASGGDKCAWLVPESPFSFRISYARSRGLPVTLNVAQVSRSSVIHAIVEIMTTLNSTYLLLHTLEGSYEGT